MGFTVTVPIGTKDFEFDTYARLLRQSGVDLGNLPRSPDPDAPDKRWLYVWATRDKAELFAEELNEQARTQGWHVLETHAPPSDGPYGPALIQLARRSDGLVFALHPLGSAMIQRAFPAASPQATSTFINTTTWNDFLKTQGTLGDLVESIAPSLTGLDLTKLAELGYAVIDAEDDRTWVYAPPSGTGPAHLTFRKSSKSLQHISPI